MGRRDSGFDKRRGTPVEYKLKLPGQGEFVGLVTKLAGATRFVVNCSDGKERLCTIPGKFKRRFWIKENDVVIVRPWTVQSDERGEIVWRYSIMDMSKLKERGMVPQ